MPAQRPWLAEGVSRSTWYRRKAKARERAGLAFTAGEIPGVIHRVLNSNFDRASSFVAQLQAELATAARCQAVAAAIIGELSVIR